jgi:hypothetical protein
LFRLVLSFLRIKASFLLPFSPANLCVLIKDLLSCMLATANTRQATGLAEGTFMLRAQVQFLKKNLKEAVAMFSLGH